MLDLCVTSSLVDPEFCKECLSENLRVSNNGIWKTGNMKFKSEVGAEIENACFLALTIKRKFKVQFYLLPEIEEG